MISWMQKHKKYLVITIWISTIAFVGAGFVGWGAYKFGSSADTMAEVGDTKITVKEFQTRYTNMYNYYNQLFGGKLDQKKAKEMGLEKLVLNELIQEAALQNYARELGLEVSDDEVAKKIASMSVFQNTGMFDKGLYLRLLEQNHIRPKDFEMSIKKELLLQKLQNALAPKVLPLEFTTVGASLFIGDKIEYKPLSADALDVNYTQKELQDFYEKHKENYKTKTLYKIALIEVEPSQESIDEKELKSFYQKNRLKYKDNNGKILSFEKVKTLVENDYRLKLAKKEALKKYIQFKKGKIKAQKELTISQDSFAIPQELLKKLKFASSGKVFKPVRKGNSYIIVKLNKKIPPRIKTFKEAKPLLVADYLKIKRKELLIQKAKKALAHFQGYETKNYICRDDVDKIKGLQKPEAAQFLKELFIQTKPQGYIVLSDNKVVLYKIKEQMLIMQNKLKKNKKLIDENSKKLKSAIQNSNLIKKLEELYEIRVYKGI